MSEIRRYQTAQGERIYQLPVEAFPGFWTNCYLVLAEDLRLLVDVGSGLGNSDEQLAAGLERVRSHFQERISFDDLTHVLISHGHIDHFGGLPFLQQQSQALVVVHQLDLPVLIDYESRLELVEQRLRQYLIEAGLAETERQELMELYLLNKSLFQSVPVDMTYDSMKMQLDRLQIIHTPGHCPGQVVMRLDDVLLSSDHILPDVSPHQSPEHLSLAAGLDHYLNSLQSIKAMAAGINLTLPGHGAPIEDLQARIEAIEGIHYQRLQQVLDLMDQPLTIAEVSAKLFPAVEGYHRLLAIEEAGAHVEYLHSRGFISLTAAPAAGDLPRLKRFKKISESPAMLPAGLQPA